MKPIPALRLALFLVLASAANLAAEERWYVFSIGGVPVGYVMDEIDGARTRTAVFARLTRLGKSIDMRFETTTTEDADGDFQSLEYEGLLSKQPVRVAARVQGDRIRITTPPHERFVEQSNSAEDFSSIASERNSIDPLGSSSSSNPKVRISHSPWVRKRISNRLCLGSSIGRPHNGASAQLSALLPISH